MLFSDHNTTTPMNTPYRPLHHIRQLIELYQAIKVNHKNLTPKFTFNCFIRNNKSTKIQISTVPVLLERGNYQDVGT